MAQPTGRNRKNRPTPLRVGIFPKLERLQKAFAHGLAGHRRFEQLKDYLQLWQSYHPASLNAGSAGFGLAFSWNRRVHPKR
jgi:hypothetical protein